MSLSNVLKFMSENKPEIIDSVIPERQPNNRRMIIQPKANAIDFSSRQALHNYKPNAALRQNASNVARLFRGYR